MTSRTGNKKFHNHCELCEYFRLELQHDGRCLERCSVTGDKITTIIFRSIESIKSARCPFKEVEDGTREEAKADSGRE